MEKTKSQNGRIVDIEQGEEEGKRFANYLIQSLTPPHKTFLLKGPIRGLALENPIGVIIQFAPRGTFAEAVNPFRKRHPELPAALPELPGSLVKLVRKRSTKFIDEES
ncbi:MAG: hypothetical protein AAGN35_09765 [Bacteroidota bacterium]